MTKQAPHEGTFILRAISAIAQAGTALTFVFAVVYDWAFFGALGLSVRELPFSLSDVVVGALHWIPQTAATLVLSMLLVHFAEAHFQLKSDADEVENAQEEFRWSKYRGPILFAASNIIYLSVYGFIKFLQIKLDWIFDFIAINSSGFVFIIALALTAQRNGVLIHVRAPERRVAYILTFMPFFVAGQGYNDGSRIKNLGPASPEYTINVDGTPMTARPIRFIEKGLIAQKNDGNIVILPTQEIDDISIGR